MNNGAPTVADIRQSFKTSLKGLYDTNEINSIVNILFDEFLGWTRIRLHLEPQAVLTEAQSEIFSSALDRLAVGCPVQYITGNADFNELKLKVNPSVLIPRPETAELAALIVQHLSTLDYSGFSTLDIGTGSGCIAIYLKKHLPSMRVYGMDNSEEALITARSNAAMHSTEIDFFQADILKDPLTGFKSSFSLIVSNPPYVTMKEKQGMMMNVRDFEPPAALFVPDEDPLKYYRAIARCSQRLLLDKGLIYFEINEAFAREVCGLLSANGFINLLLLKDFRGKDRFIKAEFTCPP